MSAGRRRLAAGLGGLLLAGLPAACSDVAFRERWVARLVQQGEYERAWAVFEALPEGSREVGDLRMQAVFALVGRHGLDHAQTLHVVALFASGDSGPVWRAAERLAETEPELARDLLDVGERLSRPGDGPETRGLLAGVRLFGAFCLLAEEGGGGPPRSPAAISSDARRRFLAALRFAEGAPPSLFGAVSGVERVGAFARDLAERLGPAEARGGALERWLAAESERP